MGAGILFDLDGTLVDTFWDLSNATNYAMQKTNNPIIEPNLIKKFIGSGTKNLIDSALGIENHPARESANEHFSEHYFSHLTYHSRPYEGITMLLKKLKEDKYKLAVVTNKRHSSAENIIEYFFPNVFDFVIGEQDNIPKKPAPDMIYAAIEALNLSKEKTIFVGDSTIDHKTFTMANVTGIVCLYGFSEREEFLQLSPKYTVEHPDEIYPLIKQITSTW